MIYERSTYRFVNVSRHCAFFEFKSYESMNKCILCKYSLYEIFVLNYKVFENNKSIHFIHGLR